MSQMSLVSKATPSLTSDKKALSDYVVVDKEEKIVSPTVRVLNKGTSQMASGLLVSRRGAGKSRSRRGSRRNVGSVLPPEIDATISFTKVYRYISQDQSATQKTVTVGNILVSLGSIPTTTTQVTSVCSSFRIKKVTIYPAQGTGTYVLFEWVEAATTGLNVRDERKTKPIPAGITVETPLVARPPKNSQMSWWWDGPASSVALFALSAPTNSVLDLEVECTLANSGTQLQESGFSGLTVGLMVYPALDGRSTNDWSPLGRINAT